MLRADVLNRDRQIIELRQQVQVAHQNTENAKLEIETLKLESQAADQRAELGTFYLSSVHVEIVFLISF
jgi:outer membrane protein TolC